jgi:GR25 family glycosyltransferase involved in LPS biosynthesis
MSDNRETTAESLSLIDKIFYINLTSRVDRNAHFNDQMKKHNIPQNKFERFNAINGAEHIFSDAEFSLFKNANYLNMATRPQIMGNQLSHFKLFQLMIERNYKFIIICQDDITFKDNFVGYIDELTRNLPEDAEVVHFGFHKYAVRDIFLPWDLSSDTRDEVSYKNVNNLVCKLKPTVNEFYNCHNTTGYILTLNGAKNYVDYALKHGVVFATDVEMTQYLINKDIFYGSRTVLATTVTTFGSDVFSNIHNRTDNASNPYNLNANNNFLNYLNKYNWTNNLPSNSNTNAKIRFVTMLANFITRDDCEILEVGTFAGTSIIGILQYLPAARATTTDNWVSSETDTNSLYVPFQNVSEYITPDRAEQVFFENIYNAGVARQILPLKGNSDIVLTYLKDNKKSYHFICINRSCGREAQYTDCLLSWEILKSGGIMAINDYVSGKKDNGVKCINRFLSEIPGQYRILEGGFILFIQKL